VDLGRSSRRPINQVAREAAMSHECLLLGVTSHPAEEWVAQQARNLRMNSAAEPTGCGFWSGIGMRSSPPCSTRSLPPRTSFWHPRGVRRGSVDTPDACYMSFLITLMG
jgi:hypothetical protein